MTSGSIVKRRVRLRRSHVRSASLLLLIFGITALLGSRLPVSPSTPAREARADIQPSWRHRFNHRLFGDGALDSEMDDDDDFHLDVPFFEEPSISRMNAHQSVVKKLRQPQLQYCTEAEYLDGLWTKRAERVTPRNIRKVFKLTDTARFRCPAKDAVEQHAANDPSGWSRIWETAQWEWTPKSGCKKHDWSRWNFAKYCLRAKAGCTIVGDSIADQIYSALKESMVTSGVSLFEINGSPNLIFNLTVNTIHPDAARLALEAGVEMERFDRPVVNYYREHHLLHRPELDAAFHDAVGYQPWTGGSPYSENGWIWDRSWWFELWSQELAKPIKLVGTNEKWRPMEERSVISFSSGPHWTTTELWPKDRWVTRNFDELLLGWARMFDIVSDKVDQAVARGDKILAWWRGSSTSHMECWQYDAPENDRTHPFSTLNPTADAYNWKLFPLMDDYAKSRTHYVPSNTSQHFGRRRGMQFIDIWKLSVTRPDAHLRPANDCSHSCAPGLANEWLEFIWHLMVNEGENDDYDDPPFGDSWWAAGMPT